MDVSGFIEAINIQKLKDQSAEIIFMILKILIRVRSVILPYSEKFELEMCF